MKICGILLPMIILLCTCVLFEAKPRQCEVCLQENTCHRPNCICCDERMPFTPRQIPQMVFFTFDDAVTSVVGQFYRRLFDSSRRNPNACPIKMTLFVSHNYTDYKLVREFYDKGMEIASHTVTHPKLNPKNILYQVREQKANLANLAGIPTEAITGFRSPFLVPVGDDQPYTLGSVGYQYDASLTFSKRKLQEPAPIPFTLDYGWPYICQVPPCPSRSHPGFWQVPVVSLIDYKHDYPCVYVDGCINAPPTISKGFKFLWDNFESYYKTSRVPFGVNMHAAWFYDQTRLEAMDKFIKKLVSMDDVYIVTVTDVLNWMKNPKTLSEIKSGAIWNCNGVNNEDNQPKVDHATTHNVIPQSPSLQPQIVVPVVDRNSQSNFGMIPQVQIPNFSPLFPPLAENCIFGTNCFASQCVCPMTHYPPAWSSRQLPQIVYIAIEGRLDQNTYLSIMRIFTSPRRNPNNCPIGGTFFLSREGSVYSLVSLLDNINVEVALSINNTVINDIGYTIQNISYDLYQESHIPFERIKGMKLHNENYIDDAYFEVLAQNSKYDSTVKHLTDNALLFPYTLDYGLTGECSRGRCLGGRHPGVWEVPNTLYVAPSGERCEYVDSCDSTPVTAAETQNFLWNNFQRHYGFNRSPYGIRISQLWFQRGFEQNFDGLVRFIDTILQLDDVYIVSIADTVEWMRDPKDIRSVGSLPAWKC